MTPSRTSRPARAIGAVLLAAWAGLAMPGPLRADDGARPEMCKACRGKKEVDCAPCKGKGKVPEDCPACEKGGVKCKECGGIGNSTCSACDGTGDYSWGTCKKCHGNKTIDCPKCKGGLTACPDCKGKGSVPGNCATCTGGGKILCAVCLDWAALAALPKDTGADLEQEKFLADLREVQAKALLQFREKIARILGSKGTHPFPRGPRVTLESSGKTCYAFVAAVTKSPARIVRKEDFEESAEFDAAAKAAVAENRAIGVEIGEETRRMLASYRDTKWGAGVDGLRVVWGTPVADAATGKLQIAPFATLHFSGKMLTGPDGEKIGTLDVLKAAEGRVVSPLLEALPDKPMPGAEE